VELLPYTDEHRALTEALELDPEVMKELGGPADPADLERVHRMRIETVARGEWYFVVVPEPSGPPVGAIGIWQSTIAGSTIHEVGWMVLPDFQGRGIASEALGTLIARARSDPGYTRIHAFPGVSNSPSNALCRKSGFVRTEETEVKFRDRPLRVNHWELDVSE
jgi:RimJ/RimL family protein N-acetyltransferase